MKSYNRYSIEDGLMTTKACYARFTEAIIKTRSKVMSTYVHAPEYDRSSWFATIDIPFGNEEEFKSIAKCSLKQLPDLQVGYEIVKSVKYYTESFDESK